MKINLKLALSAACFFTSAVLNSYGEAKSTAAGHSYKVVNSANVGGEGAFDFVNADSAARRLYVPRGDRVAVYDLDTLKLVGEIPECSGARDVAIDSKSHRGFSSSTPVVMWDTQTLATIKTIKVDGKPDAMFFDPTTNHIFVFSHEAPNATVLGSSDGTVVGTIDLEGQPEQAVSDGRGHVYVNLEDKACVAVIDAKTLKVTSRYDFSEKAKEATGLALDAKNRILFACCRNPSTCVVLSADDGKIITTLPIGAGCDAAVFNPVTMEAFTSQRDGTLTIIKEVSPTHFEVAQNVQTKVGAKTCTLDTKTNQIVLITADRTPPPPMSPAVPGQPAPRPGRGTLVPGTFTILVVGAE